jgi:hypothetical protein
MNNILNRVWLDVSGSLPRPTIKEVTDETLRLAVMLTASGIKRVPNDNARDACAHSLDFVHGRVLDHQDGDETCAAIVDAMADGATSVSRAMYFFQRTVPDRLTEKALDVAAERTYRDTDTAVAGFARRTIDNMLALGGNRGHFAVPLSWIDLEKEDDDEEINLLESVVRVSLETLRDMADDAIKSETFYVDEDFEYSGEHLPDFYEALAEASRLGLLWV